MAVARARPPGAWWPAAAFAGFSTERERGTSAAAALETTMSELDVPGDALEIPSFLREE